MTLSTPWSTQRWRRILARPRLRLPVRALLVLSTLFLGLGACNSSHGRDWREVEQEIRQRFPGVPQMSTGELSERLRRGEGEGLVPAPLVIDARAPEEYAVSHLRGALSAPDEETALRILSNTSPERPVVVYCSVGWRSSEMVERLRARPELMDREGPIWNLEGSIFRWANEGRTVVQDGSPVRGVHPYDRDWGRLLHRELWAWEPEQAERALAPEPASPGSSKGGTLSPQPQPRRAGGEEQP